MVSWALKTRRRITSGILSEQLITQVFLTKDFASYPNSKFDNIRNNMGGGSGAPTTTTQGPGTTQPPGTTTTTSPTSPTTTPTTGGGCGGVAAWSSGKVYTQGQKASYSMSLAQSPSVIVYLCTLLRWSPLDRQMVGSHLVYR